MSGRDDRTVRTLAALIGDAARAELAYTHFMGATVLVRIGAQTITQPNGYLALQTSANMLARFVGRLALDVAGELSAERDARLDEFTAELRLTDCRRGKQISRGAPDEPPDVILQVGEIEVTPTWPRARTDTIGVSFGAWTASLVVGHPVPPVSGSRVPFGALLATCFGTAEVFKVLVEAVAEGELLDQLRGRRVSEFFYSAWQADRTDGAGEGDGPAELPGIRMDDVVQVGAGAVGNASLYALRACPTIVGLLPVYDYKPVDEKNLNRCLYFREADIGRPKVDVLAERCSHGGLNVVPHNEVFSERADAVPRFIVSTVDNNAARHDMQEAIPALLIQGSTSATAACVSLHTGTDNRSCLVCRHPRRESGLTRVRALTADEAEVALGISRDAIERGQFDGGLGITEELLALVEEVNPEARRFLEEQREGGSDLCGALGDFRTRFGVKEGPTEPAVPFTSAFAGFQAAAELVKQLLRRDGCVAPSLDNVLEIDLGRAYTRLPALAYSDPPVRGCSFCRARDEAVRRVYHRRWSPRPPTD